MDTLSRMIVAVAFLATTGCSSNSSGSGKPQGSTCLADSDCAANLVCRNAGYGSTCLASCSKMGDCAAGLSCAAVAAGGSGYCVTACSGGYSPLGGCVNGVPTPCSAIVDGTSCTECNNCPSGKRCDMASDKCLPQLPQGSPCMANGDCQSGNCGALLDADGGLGASQCFVGAGTPCTQANCGSCDAVDGGEVCAQACNQQTDCPSVDDQGSCRADHMRYWPCLGAPAGGYYCRMPCDGLAIGCPTGLTCDPYTPPECSDYLVSSACLP